MAQRRPDPALVEPQSKAGSSPRTPGERLTTARALQAVRDLGGTTRGRKDGVDALAATVLLQHYLDAKRGSGV